MDATQATKVSCGWIRTGVDKPIETTGSRTRLNIVGAIRLGHLQETLTKQYTTELPIHLRLDGAGYYRSEVVKVVAKELGIILHYLPPYSPNLNPIERLWKVMNGYARNNKYFATAKKFRRHIDNFFDETLPNLNDALDSRITINDNFQTFNFAS